MSIDLQEKTKTHPTDPMCWGALPTEECILEFRPPSARQLELTTTQCLWQWTIVSVVFGAVFWVLKFWVFTWVDSLLTRGIFAAMTCAGAYALAVNAGAEQQGARTLNRHESAWAFGAVAITILLLVGNAAWGLIAYGIGGVLLLAYLANAIVQHGVGWHTANPEVGDDIRNGWRSGAKSLVKARASGISDVRLLGNEASVAIVVVAVGLLLAPLTHGLCWQLGKPTMSLWVPPLTIGTLFLFQLVWLPHSRTSAVVGGAIGHWHDYQRASPSSPMAYQSPSGLAANRTVLTWLVLAVVSASLATATSNLRPYLTASSPSFNPQFVAGIDTAVASLAAPWIVWFSVRILVAPTLVAALIRHDEEAGENWEVEV